MYNYKIGLLGLVLSFVVVGCGSSNDDVTDTSSETETETETDDSLVGYFNDELFMVLPLGEEQVSCTLENGSTTTCYQLTFAANGAGDTEGNGSVGPFCPPTIDTPRSESGVGIYDGDTNPGFQSLVDAAQGMDADGYEMVDEDGNINFNDLTSGGDADLSYCLSAIFDSSLDLVYLIPVTPELRSEPYELGTIESIGVGLNGVPIKGNPPSVTVAEAGVGGTGSGNIPSLDLCGGHADPAGYYHWHFVPQSINTVYESDEYNYTDLYGMTCSNSYIAYDNPAAFSGLAKDGFPIYGAYDSVDAVNTDPTELAELDECNGHSHSTEEFSDGVYHYHALESGAPNVPVCLMGSFVERNDFTVQ